MKLKRSLALNFLSWFRGIKLKLIMILVLSAGTQLAMYLYNSALTNAEQTQKKEVLSEQGIAIQNFGDANVALGEFRADALQALLTDLDPNARIHLLESSEVNLKNALLKIEKLQSLKWSDQTREHLAATHTDLEELAQKSQEFLSLVKESKFESDLLAKKAFQTKLSPATFQVEKMFAQFRPLLVAHGQKNNRPAIAAKSAITTFFLLGLFWICAPGLIFLVTKKLRQFAIKLEKSIQKVTNLSEVLSQNTLQLSEKSVLQSQTFKMTSVSLEEIAENIEKNVENTQGSLDCAQYARGLSQETNVTIVSLSESMKEILQSNEEIEVFATRIHEIGEKTEVIDDIAFQTKILSFNASVEAERAGEMGRGFGVVAQEVGNLAALSGKSAIEVAAIVKLAMKESREVIDVNRLRVKKGAELCDLAVRKMRELIKSTEKILESCEFVLQTSREQSHGIRQVSSRIGFLNQATESQVMNSEAIAKSSQELSQKSVNLNTQIKELYQILGREQLTQDAGHKIVQLNDSSNVELAVNSKFSPKFKLEAFDLKKASGSDSNRPKR